MIFKRDIYYKLINRLNEPRRLIQVVAGPRQVGKTTLVKQASDELSMATYYASADDPTAQTRTWIAQQWILARQALQLGAREVVLILDEIQKLPDWSSVVKQLWDEDTYHHVPLKVVLLGSAPLLLQHGLTESLAGRFEKIIATHWSYDEMQRAFGWTLPQYIYFGGYPGAAVFITDEPRWRAYVNDALIEATLFRDVLLFNPINKPALLRRLFELSCHYSGQILSYQKMMGQLQDAGNTTTLAHYLQLLTTAGMVTGLPKYMGRFIRQRAASPKLQVFNTALLTAQFGSAFFEAQKNSTFWGRLVEASVGAYLLNSALVHGMTLYYWRDGQDEVDFVLEWQKKQVAIEVKSYTTPHKPSGMKAFCQHYPQVRSLVIDGQNLTLERFLTTPITQWFVVE